MPVQLVQTGAFKGRHHTLSRAVNQDVDALDVLLEVPDERRDVRFEPEICLIADGPIRGLLGDWLQGLHSSADKANFRAVRGQGESNRLADSAICAGDHGHLIGEMRHGSEITVLPEVLSTTHGAAAGWQRYERFRKLTRSVRQYPTEYALHQTGSAPTTSPFPGAFRRDFRPLRGIALAGLTAVRI